MKIPLLVLVVAFLASPIFAATALTPAGVAALKESLPPGARIAMLEIAPAAPKLHGAFDAAQLLVTATFADGTSMDATRLATYELAGIDVSRLGTDLGHSKQEPSNRKGHRNQKNQ